MVEHELLNLGLGRHRLLNLVDEHILGLVCELGALNRVEVREIRVTVPAKRVAERLVCGRRGLAPRDSNLNVVVLKRDEREGALPVFAKEETKGVKGNLLRTILALGEVLRKEVG